MTLKIVLEDITSVFKSFFTLMPYVKRTITILFLGRKVDDDSF